MRNPSRSALPVALLTLLGGAARLQAADAPPLPHYVLDPAKSSLEFTFTQAGARNKGRFTHFQTLLDFAPENLPASHLEVTIEMNSLDSGDQERDDALRNADLFAVPLSGWLMSSARGFPVSWFGFLQLPDLVPKNKVLYEALLTTHGILAWTLGIVATVHLVAALKHHFVLKDDVLRRMLPSSSNKA